MTLPIKPALVPVYGKDAWTWVPAIAVLTAPTVAELTAVTGFNLSCSLFGEQEGVTATTEKVTLPRLLCETSQYEFIGSTTWGMADLTVSIQPQAAALSDGKKAWEAMSDGESGFLVRRLGIDAAGTDFVAGQFVNIYPSQLGVKVITKTSTGADGVAAFTVAAGITSAPFQNVAVAA